MRVCIDCKEAKELKLFPVTGKYYRTRCFPCYKVYNTAMKRNNYDSSNNRRTHLLKKYGLTVEDYEKMLHEQGGRCAICEEVETRTKNGVISALAVDHDHETGQVRGLLCYRCNLTLGYARDNVEILARAIEYLEGA